MQKMTEPNSVSGKLISLIKELQVVHKLLVSEDVDPQLLVDLRDALNRVRTVAWSVQQYVAFKNNGEGSGGVLSILAGERLRVAYQLCQSLQNELDKEEIPFQTGQLLQLHEAARGLNDRLERVIDNLN